MKTDRIGRDMTVSRARRKIRHDDETRAKIQAAQIINRLMKALNGEIELTPAQVTIGLGLLRKTLPDLAAIEHSGETTVRHDISDQPLTAEEWAERHATTH